MQHQTYSIHKRHQRNPLCTEANNNSMDRIAQEIIIITRRREEYKRIVECCLAGMNVVELKKKVKIYKVITVPSPLKTKHLYCQVSSSCCCFCYYFLAFGGQEQSSKKKTKISCFLNVLYLLCIILMMQWHPPFCCFQVVG